MLFNIKKKLLHARIFCEIELFKHLKMFPMFGDMTQLILVKLKCLPLNVSIYTEEYINKFSGIITTAVMSYKHFHP